MRRRQHTSLFNAWVRQNVGGKHFVMAIWQTGITWAPPSHLLENDHNGALKHMAQHFCRWTSRLARAVTRHKEDPATKEARIRSGKAWGRHGLTPQQVRDRADRAKARANYYQTVHLNNQLRASLGRGKSKRNQKSWAQMSKSEKWWLEQYWQGRLRTAMEQAESKCHPVQAPPFRVLGDDE